MTTPASAAVPGPAAPLVVRTVPVDLADLALLDLLPRHEPVSWLRRGEGLVGWGVAARLETSGHTRFSDAVKWWAETVARAEVDDSVNEPGTGLVCFGAFAFADEPGESVLVIPQVVVGRRGDRAWLTTVSVEEPVLAPAVPPDPPVGLVFSDGALNGEEWMSVVAEAVGRIGAGDLEKVVLARDLIATTDVPLDVRWPLHRLAEHYEMCWTFHVDGIFGATPRCWCAVSAAWSPRGCWPAPSGVRGTTTATWRSRPRSRARRRTSRSTSTPCARSPTPWSRTARR